MSPRNIVGALRASVLTNRKVGHLEQEYPRVERDRRAVRDPEAVSASGSDVHSQGAEVDLVGVVGRWQPDPSVPDGHHLLLQQVGLDSDSVQESGLLIGSPVKVVAEVGSAAQHLAHLRLAATVVTEEDGLRDPAHFEIFGPGVVDVEKHLAAGVATKTEEVGCVGFYGVDDVHDSIDGMNSPCEQIRKHDAEPWYAVADEQCPECPRPIGSAGGG